MRIRDLGEFGLIERIMRMLPAPPPNVVVGIGDDVAVLETSGPDHLLATCDIQVENVHFLRREITPRQLGRRVIAINVSDIAAMGGTPMWALVSLALPQEMEVGFVDELYEGMQQQISSAGAAIVGGNLSSVAGGIVIDLTLLGKVARGSVVCRDGAKEGDLILVTGSLGDSRAGLELILHPELRVAEEFCTRAKERHLTPQPRLCEGQALGGSGKVHAMVDVSDGLLNDLLHICRASRMAAEIWAADLPVGEASREIARASGKNVLDWALTGGEDYELLFTAAPESAHDIQKMLANETRTSCRIIGRMTRETPSVSVLLADGSRYSPSGIKGWDHFSRD